jgi:hypothetical protein
MKQKIFLLFFLISSFLTFSQNNFKLKDGIKKVTIPFKLINNLVFLPLKVNGVSLTFLLDSGAEETILFGLDENEDINLKNIKKISLRGLGSDEAVDGLKSTGNIIESENLYSSSHLMYVILDQKFNLSSHVGIPVNGIIGHTFFKNNLVEVNYSKKKIYVYSPNDKKQQRRINRRFEKLTITIEKSKPDVEAKVTLNSNTLNAKLLIDVGNSDSVWLFSNNENIKVPEKHFNDYLGQGFSGPVLGERGRINDFTIGNFKFDNLFAAFPDSSSLKHVKIVPNRVGSVGGEVLKRFTVVFDYPSNYIYLRKNKDYQTPFSYNKSGIEIRHSGLQWIKESVVSKGNAMAGYSSTIGEGTKATDFQYKFELKPIYEIGSVRSGSEAAKSGLLQGDLIVSINSKDAYKYSLKEINDLFKVEEEKYIGLEINRSNKVLKFRFKLLNVL